MTVIVFDGKTIASDGLITGDGKDPWRDKPKFELVRGCIVASSGVAQWGERFATWYAHPRRKYPVKLPDDIASGAMVIMPDGASRQYFDDSHHFQSGGDKWTIGCGYQYARAALILGHDAVAACWAAMQLDQDCGGTLWYADIKELRAKGDGAIKKQEQSRTPVRVQARIRKTNGASNLSWA